MVRLDVFSHGSESVAWLAWLGRIGLEGCGYVWLVSDRIGELRQARHGGARRGAAGRGRN